MLCHRLLQALSSIVAASDMDPMAKTRLDAMLTLYTFEFGACGRIYNTAIPFCYTRCVAHTACVVTLQQRWLTFG
jgi:predicted membrane chloride channel (bestrophin family)